MQRLLVVHSSYLKSADIKLSAKQEIGNGKRPGFTSDPVDRWVPFVWSRRHEALWLVRRPRPPGDDHNDGIAPAAATGRDLGDASGIDRSGRWHPLWPRPAPSSGFAWHHRRHARRDRPCPPR